MKERFIGFDLARAYAIFGMFIVNFNFCFGSFQDNSAVGKLLNLFTGNSTAIFIICAGIGVSLMTEAGQNQSKAEQKKHKTLILKRSWFLVAIGLLLFSWWPGDILHFYGAYMHIAAYLLFVPKKYLPFAALSAIGIFHLLLLLIPVWTSWDMTTFAYADFWTIPGFLRNTLYNGWNSVFPWIAYFFLGMWLGRTDWQNKRTQKRIFIVALICFLMFEGLRKLALALELNRQMMDYIIYDYFPPYLPFMLITASYALMIIVVCLRLGHAFPEFPLFKWLAYTGKMTLTNYVQHITIGMLIFQTITGKHYTGNLQLESPASPTFILGFAIVYFIFSVILSGIWTKYFHRGPLEMLMRKISG